MKRSRARKDGRSIQAVWGARVVSGKAQRRAEPTRLRRQHAGRGKSRSRRPNRLRSFLRNTPMTFPTSLRTARRAYRAGPSPRAGRFETARAAS